MSRANKVDLSARFKNVLGIRFIIVGAVSSGLYYAIFYLTVEFDFFSISAASFFCYLLSTAFNYIAHYLWTFETSSSHFSVGPKYIAMVGFGLLTNWSIMTFFASNYESGYLIIQFFVLILVAASNYILGRFWVFKTDG
jgi:putative flippase GtrA